MSDELVVGTSTSEEVAQIVNDQRVNKKTATSFTANEIIIAEDSENVIGSGVDIDGILKLDQTTPQTITNDTPIFNSLTASELVATDASKQLQSLSVATYPNLTEVSYLKGVTSSIQTQITGFVKKDGVSGGQTVSGSTLTNEDLNLRSNAVDLTTGSVNFLDTLEASSSTVGAVTVAGGLAVAKRIYALNMTVTNDIVGSITGNAETATALETVRTIAGQSFDGTANIEISSEDLTDTSNIVNYDDATKTFTGTGDTSFAGSVIINPGIGAPQAQFEVNSELAETVKIRINGEVSQQKRLEIRHYDASEAALEKNMVFIASKDTDAGTIGHTDASGVDVDVINFTQIGNVGIGKLANMTGMSIESGIIALKETTTPTASATYAKMWSTDLNDFNIQTGDGVAHGVPFLNTANAFTSVGDTSFAGSVGIEEDTPTALLHLGAGTATAGTAPIKLTAGTLLTTPEAGTIEFDGCRTYITNLAHQRAMDRTSDVLLSTVTVANTTVETTLYTAEMDANSLCAGNVFKISASGVISNDSGLAADQVTIRFKVGGVTRVTLAPVVKSFTDAHWHIEADSTQRTIGVTGSRASHVHMQITDSAGAGDEVSEISLGNVDTTGSLDVTITAQWASADPNNTISIYQGKTEYKN